MDHSDRRSRRNQHRGLPRRSRPWRTGRPRRALSLQPFRRLVAVDSHDQRPTQGTRGLQEPQVTDVEQVEDAVGEDNRSCPAARSLSQRFSAAAKSVTTGEREAAASRRFRTRARYLSVTSRVTPRTPAVTPEEPASADAAEPTPVLTTSHDEESSTSRTAARRCHAGNGRRRSRVGTGRYRILAQRRPLGDLFSPPCQEDCPLHGRCRRDLRPRPHRALAAAPR